MDSTTIALIQLPTSSFQQFLEKTQLGQGTKFIQYDSLTHDAVCMAYISGDAQWLTQFRPFDILSGFQQHPSNQEPLQRAYRYEGLYAHVAIITWITTVYVDSPRRYCLCGRSRGNIFTRPRWGLLNKSVVEGNPHFLFTNRLSSGDKTEKKHKPVTEVLPLGLIQRYLPTAIKAIQRDQQNTAVNDIYLTQIMEVYK